ncbi:hypothetical protein [Litorimonas sp.]|uniref:hypothetical protein n=1 Tax=Litorimonas sp. TaxID=1892381 RepID=UPI003A8C7A7F
MTKDNTPTQTDWKARLIEGYQQFRAGDYVEQKALYEELGKHGQSPKVMLIGCAKGRRFGTIKIAKRLYFNYQGAFVNVWR